MTVEPVVYNVDEVAELLGIGRSSVYRRIADGTIRTVKVGRRVLIPRAALEELLAEAVADLR
jgi:excisionase family DNA binding protein